MTVAAFLKGGVDSVTVVPSSLLPKKKGKKEKTKFQILVCASVLRDIMWDGWKVVVVQKVVPHIPRH